MDALRHGQAKLDDGDDVSLDTTSKGPSKADRFGLLPVLLATDRKSHAACQAIETSCEGEGHICYLTTLDLCLVSFQAMVDSLGCHGAACSEANLVSCHDLFGDQLEPHDERH